MTSDDKKLAGGRRAVIFSGGRLGEWALEDLRPDDVLIGADRGALFLVDNGCRPAFAVGDFDSVSADELERIRRGSDAVDAFDAVDKDYTDTELAFERALALEPSIIVLRGGLGTRFDHSLANVHLLVTAYRRGATAVLADEHNEIRLVTRAAKVRRGRFTHLSLLPLTPEVTGITLTGFQYPLRDATLVMGQSLGISNIVTGDEALIEIGAGWLLAIQSRD